MPDSFRPIREALEYDRRYEEAAQFRDWQTCEFLQDARPEEIEQALAALARLEAEHERWREALEAIDRTLTTVEGDNVPRGEAPKLAVRALARSVLSGEENAGREAEDTSSAKAMES